MLERFDLRQFVLLTTGVFVAIFLVGQFGPSERSDRDQRDKGQIALWGGLEIEYAVHALKNAILRGDPAYNADFDRSMREVERATNLYRSYGTLSPEEQQALDRLRMEVPHYRSAMATVQRMRDSKAPITEIDRAVKGEDRPISAAFEKLHAAAAAQGDDAQGVPTRKGVATALVCALLSGLLVALGQFGLDRIRTKGGSLRHIAMKVVHWEEEKQWRASQRLREGVCQSFAAVMFALRGDDTASAEPLGGPLRARIDAVLRTAIRDTQAIATDLYPFPIGGIGLLGSLESIWADARHRCPQLKLTAVTDVQEADVPEALQREIERLAPMAVEWARKEPGACQLVWTLSRERRRIRLGIGVQATVAHQGGLPGRLEGRHHAHPAEAITARLRLSGAMTCGAKAVPGGQALVAYWRPR